MFTTQGEQTVAQINGIRKLWVAVTTDILYAPKNRPSEILRQHAKKKNPFSLNKIIVMYLLL